jgi:hypothetical protein
MAGKYDLAGEKRFVGDDVVSHSMRFSNSDLSLDEAVKDFLDSGEAFTLPNLDLLEHIGSPKSAW